MAVMDASAQQRARLVGEEGPEGRDYRNKSGIDEILDHVLDVLVSGGSLFIQQVPFAADNPATQRRLGQLMHAEAFAHAQTGLAPCPFAAGAMSQRPGIAFALTHRLHQVAQRAAGARDYHRLAFGRHSPLAVNPDNLPLGLPTSDAVVTAVPDALGFSSERLDETPRDERAIGLGPTHGLVMVTEVGRRSEELSIRATGVMLLHIGAEDGFAQPT